MHSVVPPALAAPASRGFPWHARSEGNRTSRPYPLRRRAARPSRRRSCPPPPGRTAHLERERRLDLLPFLCRDAFAEPGEPSPRLIPEQAAGARVTQAFLGAARDEGDVPQPRPALASVALDEDCRKARPLGMRFQSPALPTDEHGDL